MNKLDNAIQAIELAEKIYNEKIENSTPKAVLIILQAAREFSAMLKLAPDIAELVKVPKEIVEANRFLSCKIIVFSDYPAEGAEQHEVLCIRQNKLQNYLKAIQEILTKFWQNDE